MKKLLTATVALLLSSAAGLADKAPKIQHAPSPVQQPVQPQTSYAIHNGSRMVVQTQPPAPNGAASFAIYYDLPSPWMAPLVHPGELLVDGIANLNDGSIVANARVFLSGCPMSFPYRVTGAFTERGMILEGPAPVIYPGCVVANLTWSANSHLEFIKL